MTNFQIDRRNLIKMGFAASALSWLPLSCIEMSHESTSDLLEFVSESELPINGEQTGRLTTTEFKALASLCSYVNRVWELTLDLDQYFVTLESDLELKTSEVPSYLKEYRNAIGLIQSLEGHMTTSDVWTMLLFADFEQEDLSNTKIGRARRLVFAEIIAHFVPVSGGFKSFGLWNYRGYFGGPYISDMSYRKQAGE